MSPIYLRRNLLFVSHVSLPITVQQLSDMQTPDQIQEYSSLLHFTSLFNNQKSQVIFFPCDVEQTKAFVCIFIQRWNSSWTVKFAMSTGWAMDEALRQLYIADAKGSGELGNINN